MHNKKFICLLWMVFSILTPVLAASEVTAECGSQVTISATPKEGHHFVRWNDNNTDNPRIVEVTANATYIAYFAPNKYMITWRNWDNSELYKAEFDYGTTPVYGGAVPTKPADAQYTYTFDSWSPNIHVVTGEETYTAVFAQTVNQYTVTFKNWDGSVLQSTSVAYGDMPNYTGAVPTKPATAQYTYTFSGWDKEIASVTGNVVYTAQFEETVNKYIITFNNWDGTTLAIYEVEYGKVPIYTGVTPTKTSSDEYTYVFAGWTPAIVPVTGNATYTATFSNDVNSYTITLHAENGTVTGAGTYTYGTSVNISATPAECYHFVQWSDGDTNASRTIVVTDDITLTAIFEINTYVIRVESADETQGTVSVTK